MEFALSGKGRQVATLLLESTCPVFKAQNVPRVCLSVHTFCLMTRQTACFDSLWELSLSTSCSKAHFCLLKWADRSDPHLHSDCLTWENSSPGVPAGSLCRYLSLYNPQACILIPPWCQAQCLKNHLPTYIVPSVSQPEKKTWVVKPSWNLKHFGVLYS